MEALPVCGMARLMCPLSPLPDDACLPVRPAYASHTAIQIGLTGVLQPCAPYCAASMAAAVRCDSGGHTTSMCGRRPSGGSKPSAAGGLWTGVVGCEVGVGLSGEGACGEGACGRARPFVEIGSLTRQRCSMGALHRRAVRPGSRQASLHVS